MKTNKKNSEKNPAISKRNPDTSGMTKQDEDEKLYVSPDKYLAMEQAGVTYTQEHNPTQNSDALEIGNQPFSDTWDPTEKNSRNSEAFNQDDYILTDNIDLDEDQSQSISSDEDFDSNTLDETR